MRLALSIVAVAALLLLARPLRACLWDEDTLDAEAKGAMADVVSIIAGRFERNPPLYFEMRRKRSAGRIAVNPDDLAAYDDAGVACDRLGLGDEAIAWMEKKRLRLDAPVAPAGKPYEHDDHRYRYLANVGTFRVHRWARAGADRSKIDEVETARDFIAKAIALNPNAHFGREAYQLKALDWIIRPVNYLPNGGLTGFLDPGDPANATDAAVRGLSGLIALGNGWESVDIFNTLAQALKRDGERSSVAMLATLRCDELIDAGRRSLNPEATTDPELLKREIAGAANNGVVGGPRDGDDVRRAYRKLRVEADAWQQARLDYMLPRLQSGRHPDTDPDFWKDYREAPAPSIPAVLASVRPTRATGRFWAGRRAKLGIAATLAAILIPSLILLRRIRQGRKPIVRTAEV